MIFCFADAEKAVAYPLFSEFHVIVERAYDVAEILIQGKSAGETLIVVFHVECGDIDIVVMLESFCDVCHAHVSKIEDVVVPSESRFRCVDLFDLCLPGAEVPCAFFHRVDVQSPYLLSIHIEQVYAYVAFKQGESV